MATIDARYEALLIESVKQPEEGQDEKEETEATI